MGLFNWLFGVGDTVETKDGQVGKVKGFKPEGGVDIQIKDRYGNEKIVSKFGGSLKQTKK